MPQVPRQDHIRLDNAKPIVRMLSLEHDQPIINRRPAVEGGVVLMQPMGHHDRRPMLRAKPARLFFGCDNSKAIKMPPIMRQRPGQVIAEIDTNTQSTNRHPNTMEQRTPRRITCPAAG
jgi:hypothetical protein